VVLPVVGKALVELRLFFPGDVRRLALPNGLVLVDLLVLVVHLLDLLGLLLLLLLALLLDLAFIFFFVLVLLWFLLLFVIIVCDFLLLGLLAEELDRELDELGMLADDVLQLLLVKLLQLVVLHVQDNTGAALQALGLLWGCGADRELLARAALPDLCIELVLLGDDGHFVGDKEAGLESYSELADQRDVCSTLVVGLYELACARVGDDTQALHQVGLAHSDACVLDYDGVVGFVGHDADAEVALGLELFRSCDGDVADLVSASEQLEINSRRKISLLD